MSGARRRRARHAAVAVAGALTLALASCGSDPPRAGSGAPTATADACDWPTLGNGLSRTFASVCESGITPETVGDLQQKWFFNTDDVVTASPAVVGDTAYVGDWSGRFYAIDTETGQPRWTFQAETDPQVYAGQIVSSAAVAEVGGVATVFFGSGRTLHALRADSGEERWSYRVGAAGAGDFTEIESSPAVADGKVLFGIDVHNQRAQPAGLFALDAATGTLVWHFDAEEGDPVGCGDVWSSPSVDLDRRLAFIGTANCPASPEGWGRYTEAIIAVGLDDGQARWSYQPHGPNNDDLDFAGAPNLFRAADRDLVGLGNKDGTYYAVDRDTGELAWKAVATGPGLDEKGSNFSTGGFIAPTAYSDGTIAGGTAVGPDPYLHAMDAATGDLVWQSKVVQATYAPSAVVNGVLFNGGNDFTLRAFDLKTGDVLWQHEMKGVVAGGPAVVGDSVYAVAGIREPGLEAKSENSGIYRFELPAGDEPAASTTSSTETTLAPRAEDLVLEPTTQTCVGSPCDLFATGITLRPPPAGLQPTATLEITTDPFRITIRASGLGRPEQWLQEGSPAADAGATVFGLFISESDDNPVGGVLCILDDSYSCAADSLPRLTSYNRISLLALERPDSVPTPSDGPARLIVTTSFDPPLTPVGAPPD
jgi:outer membrane protein assembly factor BamB